jgi:hypothetical protein
MPRASATFTLQSPPVGGLEPYISYKVEVLVFDTPERAHQIGQHVQYVQYVQSLVAF